MTYQSGSVEARGDGVGSASADKAHASNPALPQQDLHPPERVVGANRDTTLQENVQLCYKINIAYCRLWYCHISATGPSQTYYL